LGLINFSRRLRNVKGPWDVVILIELPYMFEKLSVLERSKNCAQDSEVWFEALRTAFSFWIQCVTVQDAVRKAT